MIRAMVKLRRGKLKCQRCGHEWMPRTNDVRQCPNRKCHSTLWDCPFKVGTFKGTVIFEDRPEVLERKAQKQ